MSGLRPNFTRPKPRCQFTFCTAPIQLLNWSAATATANVPSNITRSNRQRRTQMLAVKETPVAMDWSRSAQDIADRIAAHCERHDADDTFVEEGFAELASAGFFKALVPSELGGGGASVGEICAALRILGATCGSTALAAAMHSH